MNKHVFFDTNSRYFDADNEIYKIHESAVRAGKLAEGDLVTAYMEGEQWDARIVRHGEQWGIVLLSEFREMSSERYEGQQEGYAHGRLIERLRTLRVLEGLNLPGELLEEAKRRLELA